MIINENIKDIEVDSSELATPDYDKAIKMAVNLIKEFNKIYKGKIDLDEIAEKYKIEILESEEDLLHGILELFAENILIDGVTITGFYIKGNLANEIGQKENGIIILNKNMTSYRKRFTIAHQLGHVILNHYTHKDLVVLTRHNNNSIEEKEANAFADELLMPKKYIFDFMYKYIFENNKEGNIVSRRLLNNLANDLSVSILALRNRLNKLKYIIED